MDEEAEKSTISLSEKMWNWKIQLVEAYKRRPLSYWILLLLSSGLMLVALPAAGLTGRMYYQNGGKSKWIISWATIAGWPITALMLPPSYFFLKTYPTPLTLQLLLSYLVLGFINCAHNMMFAYAYAYLPASTGTLLSSAMLVFSCLFGYIIVNNKLNASIINAVVIITAAITIVALDSDSGDRYDNVSDHQYIWGFIWDVLASIFHALLYPLYELLFNTILGRRSFVVVLEQRAMVSIFTFVFTSIGVIVNKDFEGMKSEAETFVGGVTCYVKLLIWVAITFQLGAIGITGIVFLASSVTAGVQNAVAIPITSIAAVLVLNDPMSGLKMMSFLLTFWGFACYIYATSPSSNISST
ncbi:probable purine permease 5 [Euphorbia lathyris]|uniref:probable purine permease 5 n=1 Tax=Euphorbia lathyris TaxID=212925 RepID=UPI0033141B78